MTPENLELHIRQLADASRDEVAWVTLKTTDHGKAILRALKDEREMVRSSYRMIPAHEPAANVTLSGLQGEERKLDAMIAKIEGSESERKRLDEEIAMAQDLLRQKKSTREQR